MRVFLKQWKAISLVTMSIAALGLTSALSVLQSASASSMPSDPAALYNTKCVACHGADGRANTPAGKKLGAHDFRTFKGDMDAVITNGKGKMPAYGKRLGADKCKELAAYIHTTFQ
jgi:cytochrome c6